MPCHALTEFRTRTIHDTVLKYTSDWLVPALNPAHYAFPLNSYLFFIFLFSLFLFLLLDLFSIFIYLLSLLSKQLLNFSLL